VDLESLYHFLQAIQKSSAGNWWPQLINLLHCFQHKVYSFELGLKTTKNSFPLLTRDFKKLCYSSVHKANNMWLITTWLPSKLWPYWKEGLPSSWTLELAVTPLEQVATLLVSWLPLHKRMIGMS
jgi:hypothetical protein